MDHFLGLTATAWTAIYTLLTGALLIVAILAAWYAYGQWTTARKQAESSRDVAREATRPYVIVSIESSPTSRQLFDLVITNIGSRPARDVRITMDPPPLRVREVESNDVSHSLAKAKMLTQPISMIAPKQDMRAFYDSYIGRLERTDVPHVHEVTVSYMDSSGMRYDDRFTLDLNAMEGTLFTNVKTVHDVGTTLDNIARTLSSASVLNSRGHLDVDSAIESRHQRDARVAHEHREHEEAMREHLRQVRPDSEVEPEV